MGLERTKCMHGARADPTLWRLGFLELSIQSLKKEKKEGISAHAMLLMRSRAPHRRFILQSECQNFFLSFHLQFCLP